MRRYVRHSGTLCICCSQQSEFTALFWGRKLSPDLIAASNSNNIRSFRE